MQVLEPHGARFALALERLRAGHAFTFDGVGFWLAPDDHLDVQVNSSYRIENVTEQTAWNDLNRAMSVVNDLTVRNASFAMLVKAHRPRFILIYDYGTGAVELCRLVSGALVWAKGMPAPADTA